MAKGRSPLRFIKELGRGLSKMGVLFDNYYGEWSKAGYCGIPALVGEGTPISPIDWDRISQGLSKTSCLSSRIPQDLN